ncbi:gliding motility-associated C-terminal domain-containing protein [Spirosoma rhododendri]|uniref:Gliding motility-associated C-terminal domain-containing protein n=1 Tax=Spirosoma rhododendri TaxID=2728024 RepID=A0A7L5DUZ3_9BACT|nr:gliding motility-associated C-terminal domain-containing protein [Spirosoma rhododendri]QJD79777.1 gliding motility-associated C-terminal domain-containing protein [Spirosoma rhododendri]
MLNMYRFVWWWVSALAGLWLVSGGVARATHIVGGELELQRLTNSSATHRINLNLYFDVVNGSPQAEDISVMIFVFRKRDNVLVGNVEVARQSSQNVTYSNSTCARTDLQTKLIRYSADVTLSQNLNDPGGYYMSWERCCRNNVISNITNPGGAGSAFYLEFPAPYVGTTPYTNSSPVFGVAKGDYICIGRPFTFDFGAKDPDGDSLTYKLVTPYNGFSTATVPNPGLPSFGAAAIANPGPYPDVRWITGISTANEIPGTAPLQVNPRTGLLSVTADRAGLYVFSVEVDEYRRGVRIGRVRRDFQLKVIDCPKNEPPQLLFKLNGQKDFYREGTLVTLAEKDTNCLSLYVTDTEANQRITITNMSGSLPGLTLTPGVLQTKTTHDTLQTQFCFGRCVGNGGPVTLLIRATDEGCPQGLSDTLMIRLQLIGSANNKPKATTNLINNRGRVTVGSSLSFTAFGTDVDNDNISIQAVGRGFTLAQAGMSFGSASGVGKVSNPFVWKPGCTDATRAEYLVDFVVTDTRCNSTLRDTVTVNLGAVGLPSQPPSVRTSLSQQTVTMLVSTDPQAGGSSFVVTGDDPDRDTLLLTGVGRGFDMKAAGMNFTGKTGRAALTSPFDWKPTCELLGGKSEATFVVDFTADDRSCQPQHTAVTTVTFVIKDQSVNAEITVPNVFTPNGDGMNDVFTVKNLPDNACAEQFKSVEISNRYGRIVFTSRDPKFAWDGADMPTGTYYYFLQTTKRTFKGPVTLIR